MTLVPFGFWASSGGGLTYWLSTLGGASTDVGTSVAVDSADNVYVGGFTQSTGSGSKDFLIAKQDSAGAIQWQRTLGGSSDDEVFSIKTDSNNNLYVLGRTNSDGAGGADFLLAKYNSAGTIQWQRTLGGAQWEYGYAVAVDSADNVYVTGFTASGGAGGDDLLLAKYNSSGTIQWQRTLGGSSDEQGFGIAIDSADNVYVGGVTNSTGAGSGDFSLAKYNSAGTIQWQRVLGGSGNDSGQSVAIDSSDNVYILGRQNSAGAGNVDFLLAKYNSSGTIQWQRILGGGSNEYGLGVAIDSADNVYAVGYGNDTKFLIVKYNPAGTVQFQRTLSGGGTDKAASVAIDSVDSIYVFGFTQSTGAGGSDFLLAKLPNDGSLTGTYVLDGENMVYEASSYTAATSTLTANSSSLTNSTSTFTSSTSSVTDSSSSLTAHLVEL